MREFTYRKIFDNKVSYLSYLNACRKSTKVVALSGGFNYTDGVWNLYITMTRG